MGPSASFLELWAGSPKGSPDVRLPGSDISLAQTSVTKSNAMYTPYSEGQLAKFKTGALLSIPTLYLGHLQSFLRPCLPPDEVCVTMGMDVVRRQTGLPDDAKDLTSSHVCASASATKVVTSICGTYIVQTPAWKSAPASLCFKTT